jgi:hypothetical protein
MRELPHSVKDIDLLRWVAANSNKPFDPNMVVSTSTAHTTDWEWQAVLHQMEELARQNYIRKIKQDPGGSTYWTITQRGESYLRALENAERGILEANVGDVSFGRPSPLAQTIKSAPPRISKEFARRSISLNGTTRLTFAITNPNPKSELTEVGFDDVLPAGLVISNPNGLVGSWAQGNLTAVAGSDRVSLSGATLPGNGTCSFQLAVTGVTEGIKHNITGDVTSKEGGIGDGAVASIMVEPTNVQTSSSVQTKSFSESLNQATVDRFSESLREVFRRADQIRISRGRLAVSTLHLLVSLADQPGGQLPELLRRAKFELNSLVPPTDDPSAEGPAEDFGFSGPFKFPPITPDVRLALLRARNKADEMSSATVDDNHLLFGLLSLDETDNPLIGEFKRKGITSESVKLSPLQQNGPSTHVARDRWTVHDSLGYFPYAYGIYRFLTDKNTSPPLAISIQAPWGGGKTSMMRMIQGQLDPDSLKLVDKTATATKRATVGDVMNELGRLSEIETPASVLQAEALPHKPATKEDPGREIAFQVPPIAGEGEHRVTIWFNAWKYESTAQVWAGLADSIVHQISDRLGPIERELFCLRLQLRRIDVATVRRKIYEQIFARFLEKLPRAIWKYVLGPTLSVSVAIIGQVSHDKVWESVGWVGFVATVATGLIAASKRWRRTVSEVETQPARLSLGECVEAPDYGANLGFVHHVANDLRKVFQLIPKRYRPMVIFIDDLDRCSPSKVSDVIEAINLFLAGEFPDCMFVLGIDDEMVAAALDKAHSDVISRLPSYAKSASIGWRFMDKFVQLPFIVPPPKRDELKKYANSLFLEDSSENRELDLETRSNAVHVIEREGLARNPQNIVEQVAEKKSLNPEQRKLLEEEVVVIQQMDQNIKEFSDQGQQMKSVLASAAADFSTNPRDIKRFINVFRFYYFLRAAREARGDPVPSLSQLSRWILFSLRWPEAVRYLGRAHLHPTSRSHPQLGVIETLAEQCGGNEDTWRVQVAKALGMKAEESSWFWSREIMRFFRQESELPDHERLSASYGKGLW